MARAAKGKPPRDELSALYDDLAADPGNPGLRKVLGDWLEDHDQPAAAECVRWTAANGKRPYPGSARSFVWFDAGKVDESLGDPESNLPAELFGLLEGGAAQASHRRYPSLREAEEALQAAWARKGKRRKRGK
jgi:uncharacterized protein (TIGR02996 family)